PPPVTSTLSLHDALPIYGNPAYLLTAATGLYYAEDDHFELEAPRLTARKATSGTQPWLLTAAIARSSNLGQQVVLSGDVHARQQDRKSTRLNSSHVKRSY